MELLSKKDLVAKLRTSKKFRDAYVYEHVRNGIPFQTRALRTSPERDWTQAELGAAAKKPRNVITRLENPNYGKLTLKTLFEIASAFDVALLIKFVPFSRLLREYEDVSSEALNAKSITDEEEVGALERWAAEEEVEPVAARLGESTSPLRSIGGNANAAPATGQRGLFPRGVEREMNRTIEDYLRRPTESDQERAAQNNPLTATGTRGQR